MIEVAPREDELLNGRHECLLSGHKWVQVDFCQKHLGGEVGLDASKEASPVL